MTDPDDQPSIEDVAVDRHSIADNQECSGVGRVDYPDDDFDRLVSAVVQRLVGAVTTTGGDDPKGASGAPGVSDEGQAGDPSRTLEPSPHAVRGEELPIEEFKFPSPVPGGADPTGAVGGWALTRQPVSTRGVPGNGLDTPACSDWAALRSTDRSILTLIAGDTHAARPNISPEDSAELLGHLLGNWQILSAITEDQVRHCITHLLSSGELVKFRNAWLAIKAFSQVQIEVSRQLLSAFGESGLKYSLLKGSAAAFLLYPEGQARAAWDLDVGVGIADLRMAEDLAQGVGYQAAQQDPNIHRFYQADPRYRAKVEGSHYELGFLIRRLRVSGLSAETLAAIRAEPWSRRHWFDVDDGDPCCYAAVDIHHALSLDIPLDDLLASARTITAKGQPVGVPDDAWLAAHLIFKIYWEGVHSYGKGLYMYADLVRLAPRLKVETFGRLVRTLDDYKLTAAGHYVLRRLPEFGVSLPAHVLRFVAATASPPAGSVPLHLNDQGDMWFKLWRRR